ncbi:MAG: hypothetical protein KGL22_00525, partial [Alphaproteobacteria bacterium]|nr:hypothetical protein [Alphaproteobacteria bacterium]
MIVRARQPGSRRISDPDARQLRKNFSNLDAVPRRAAACWRRPQQESRRAVYRGVGGNSRGQSSARGGQPDVNPNPEARSRQGRAKEDKMLSGAINTNVDALYALNS